VKVVGKVSEDDFWRWVGDFYSGTITSLVLWDLVQADMAEMGSAMTNGDILEHVRQVNEVAAKVRKGGRTAIVVDDNIHALHLSIRLESLADAHSSPFLRKTFRSMDDALIWLGIKDAEHEYQDRQGQNDHRENRNR